jgi:hypothetical protein
MGGGSVRDLRRDAARARELRRYLMIGKSIGGLVLLLSVALVVNGVSTGTRPVMFVIFGLILAEVGIVFIRFFRRPSTRQKWVQRHCPPRTMRVTCESEDAGITLVALLYPEHGDAAEVNPVFRVPIADPDRKRIPRGSLEACSVYVDPETAQPAVIETEDVVYWAVV